MVAKLFDAGGLTFGLQLLVDQFDMNVAHLGTMMVDCHLDIVHYKITGRARFCSEKRTEYNNCKYCVCN